MAAVAGSLGSTEGVVDKTPSKGQGSTGDTFVDSEYALINVNSSSSDPITFSSHPLSLSNCSSSSASSQPYSHLTATTGTSSFLSSQSSQTPQTSQSSYNHGATSSSISTANPSTTTNTTTTTNATAKLSKSPSNSSFSFARAPSSSVGSPAGAESGASPVGGVASPNSNTRLVLRDDKKSVNSSYVTPTPRAGVATEGPRSSYIAISPAAAAHAAESARPLEEILESVDTGPVGELELTELRRLTASARRSEARKTLTLPPEVKKTNVVLSPKGRENYFEGRTSQESLYYQIMNNPVAPISLVFFMHGIDESLDTPGCAKLVDVWGSRGHVVVGIELHRHGRSSCKNGKRAILPAADVVISEVEELIMALRSSMLPQALRVLPFALAGHSLGGAVAIILSYRFSKTVPERFLGCLLMAPAVDTYLDSSCSCCNCGCCCAPSYTHCCSLAHPIFACFASCFSKACCGCCLPMDDPSSGKEGYHEEKERMAYRSSPHNTIQRFQPASLRTLIDLMRMIQTPSYWPSTPSPTPIPFFMLFGDKDTIIPPRSLINFAKAQGMERVSPATKMDDVRGKTSVFLYLEKGNHQILGYRRKADNTDEIRSDTLPLMAAWLESRILRPPDRQSNSHSLSKRSKDSE